MQLNIDTREVRKYARILKDMSRSALPVAVRTSLNSAAFDVKQNTMPTEASASFVKRQANFFKANSRVEKATGFDIGKMKSAVGFIPLNGTNKAVDDLEQQEHGGNIGGRSFIALKQARTSNSWNKKVKSKARISQINNIVDTKDASGTDEEKFIKSAIHAGKGGWLIGNRTTGGGNKILFKIRSITRKNKKTVVDAVPMHALKKGRNVNPKATHFMGRASTQSGGKINKSFNDAAKKQIEKYKQK